MWALCPGDARGPESLPYPAAAPNSCHWENDGPVPRTRAFGKYLRRGSGKSPADCSHRLLDKRQEVNLQRAR